MPRQSWGGSALDSRQSRLPENRSTACRPRPPLGTLLLSRAPPGAVGSCVLRISLPDRCIVAFLPLFSCCLFFWFKLFKGSKGSHPQLSFRLSMFYDPLKTYRLSDK